MWATRSVQAKDGTTRIGLIASRLVEFFFANGVDVQDKSQLHARIEQLVAESNKLRIRMFWFSRADPEKGFIIASNGVYVCVITDPTTWRCMKSMDLFEAIPCPIPLHRATQSRNIRCTTYARPRDVNRLLTCCLWCQRLTDAATDLEEGQLLRKNSAPYSVSARVWKRIHHFRSYAS